MENAYQPPTEEPQGCVTQAQERIRCAMLSSEHWGCLASLPGVGDLDADELADRIVFDRASDPEDGVAFTLDELAERRILCTLISDPDDTFTISTIGGTADVAATQWTLIGIIEVYVGDGTEDPFNYYRHLLNHSPGLASDVWSYMLPRYGRRYLRSVTIPQGPMRLWSSHEDPSMGHRYQVAMAFPFGNAGEDE